MFEENKIRNPLLLVCKILKSIWNILLVGKWSLHPYAQPVPAVTIAGLQHTKNWSCVFIFLMMLCDSHSDPAEPHQRGLIRKRGGKKRIFLCHCFCWAHWCGKCKSEVCVGFVSLFCWGFLFVLWFCLLGFGFFVSKIVTRFCQENKKLELQYIKIFSGSCWQLKCDEVIKI